MGNALSGAQVYVCSQPATTTTIPPSPLVQLYADSAGTTPITQPVLTDGYGHAFYYVSPGTYTVVYYSPQILETILPDQTIGSGNVSFPITVAEGGTNATTAPQALINLGAAANGANSDITSLLAVGSTGGASTTSTFNASGWQFGNGTFNNATALAKVANQAWGGTGFTGLAFGIQDAANNFSLVSTGGVFTSGTLSGNFIRCLGNLTFSSPSGVLSVNTIQSANSGTPVSLTGQGIVGAGSVTAEIIGAGTLGVGLLGFTAYPTQTTVGAAGAASALPATPAAYLNVSVNGTVYEIPLYTKV